MAMIAPRHYQVPSGRVGRRFVECLSREFHGVRAGTWNLERPLVFVSTVLQRSPVVRKAHEIRKRLTHRMNLWDEGKFTALIDNTEAEVLKQFGASSPPQDKESIARSFNNTVLSGRLRQAVRRLTNRTKGGGVLQPDDKCTKTGRPVL